MAELYKCNCLACTVGLPHVSLAADDPEQLFTDDEILAFLHRVYKGAYDDGTYDPQRAAKYAAEFSNAITEGYGKSLAEVDYDTPDAEMLTRLAKDAFHFSAAKTRAEIVSLSSAMLDDAGKLRTFAEFQREAAGITGEFSGPWLRAEYNNAIAASQMASQWVRIADKPTDVLVYRTVGDARVREAHRELDGIARPADHSFWDTFYPPNGWNCRCDVQRSTVSGNRGDIPGGAIDNVPKMFQVNLAKEGLAFPPKHPYYQA